MRARAWVIVLVIAAAAVPLASAVLGSYHRRVTLEVVESQKRMVTKCAGYYDENCIPQVITVSDPDPEVVRTKFRQAWNDSIADFPMNPDQASCGPPIVCTGGVAPGG